MKKAGMYATLIIVTVIGLLLIADAIEASVSDHVSTLPATLTESAPSAMPEYDEAIKRYEKENYRLKLIAERRELQFKIVSYESRLRLRTAKPKPKPADPNE